MKRILALLLCLSLLCGCTGMPGITKYEDMKYVRPDLDELKESCEAACALAAEGDDPEAVLDAVWAYYDVYDAYSTNYDLAYIRYHGDLTDEYWRTEHDFCAENYALLDMYLEDLYKALTVSPHRPALEEQYFGEEFLLDYEGEGWYDQTLLDLLEQEQELVSEYYALCESTEAEPESAAWYDALTLPLADLLARLTALRQEMAGYLGYESYTALAWDWYYVRDYTPAQAEGYLEQIRTELVPLYEAMNAADPWAVGQQPCSEKEVFEYVKTAAEAMGGEVNAAFWVLDKAGHYDISASEKKSGLSFEVYLQAYDHPFVFVSGTGTRYDCLTFAHEFGHAAMDYASFGSGAGTDVAEVFSQAMEYLSLCYADADVDFVRMKLADSLSTYVEQAAYADFEMQLYTLPGEALTGERLLALYDEICTGYGFGSWDWDPRDLIAVPHFYEHPMYVISYVVSNDAAMQLYEMELANPGAGAACFREHLSTEAVSFLEFLREAGLKSPFQRIDSVRGILEEYFG